MKYLFDASNVDGHIVNRRVIALNQERQNCEARNEDKA